MFQAATERFLDIASLSAEERNPGAHFLGFESTFKAIHQTEDSCFASAIWTWPCPFGLRFPSGGKKPDARPVPFPCVMCVRSGLVGRVKDMAAYMSHNALTAIEPVRVTVGAGAGTRVRIALPAWRCSLPFLCDPKTFLPDESCSRVGFLSCLGRTIPSLWRATSPLQSPAACWIGRRQPSRHERGPVMTGTPLALPSTAAQCCHTSRVRATFLRIVSEITCSYI